MSQQIPLRCRCGHVRGVATHTSPRFGVRLICYCDDCQSFMRYLGREDVLDAAGGTDIFQMAPGRLRITEGKDALRCLRLSDKGLLRWYTGCCRTPIGATLPMALPFVGVVHAFMEDGSSRNALLGKPTAGVFGRFARGPVPPGTHAEVPFAMKVRAISKVLGWWLTGKGKPSPFFEAGKPVVEPQVLTASERDGLQQSPLA